MFTILSRCVTRAWPLVLAVWAGAVALLWLFAPAWDQVGRSGQFSYLPADAPTQRAEALFNEAFPGERAASSIVLVVTRTDGGELQPADRRYVQDVLAARLRQELLPGGRPAPGSPVVRIRSPGDKLIGALLESADRRAELVDVELNREFLDSENWPTVAAVEHLVHALRGGGGMPADLDVSLTGSAALGRDISRAEVQSAVAVQRWTIVVVVAILLLVYRAPLLAVIPLAVVFVALEVSLRLLGLLAEAAHWNLYQGVRLYATVVGYGAGVDYCLFIIARSKERWEAGAGAVEGVRDAVAKVGPAVTASAATVVIGISMMGFADFTKIRQAGLGIAFSLAFVLLSALTLAPAILCLTGRWALWPRHRMDQPDAVARRGEQFWTRVGHVIARWPGTVLVATCVLLAPCAVFAALRATRVSYDVTRNLPAGAPSAAGTEKLRAHFPSGETAPVTVLLKNDRIDFRTPQGRGVVKEVAGRLLARSKELGIADIRSVENPLGTGPSAQEMLARVSALGAGLVHEQAAKYYVAGPGGHVTRLEVVLASNPLSQAGIRELDQLEQALHADLSGTSAGPTEVWLLGSAAGMRDLETISTRDRTRVDLLVAAAVFAVLLALLRQPLLSAYLILTVVLGYLTTLGLTYLVFWAIEPGSFPGLDWKVPLFLFTILVAVGEDYNIFLITRVREEEQLLGTKAGTIAALGKTGGVITSCGLIMAGTFASLFAGALWEMAQMGFALCSGVLLDTFIVRPVLVPAFIQLTDRLGGSVKESFA